MQRQQNTLTITETEKNILTKHFPKGIVAFDLEMTGLSPVFDKIIEIAAVKIDENGELTSFHQMINPLITIPEYTIEYHGITNDMVKECPTLKKPLKDFKEFFGNLPIIAHNAQFDLGFIVRGHHEYNFDFSLSDVYDSCKFARIIYKKKEDKPSNYKLSTLAEFFEIDFNHHQALDDAAVSLKVFANTLLEYEKHTAKRNLKDMAYIFKLNSFRKPADYILPKKLHPLQDKLKNRSLVHIQYRGSSTGDEFRPIKPIAILPMPQGLILYAECQIDNMNKHFMVKKIKGLKVD